MIPYGKKKAKTIKKNPPHQTPPTDTKILKPQENESKAKTSLLHINQNDELTLDILSESPRNQRHGFSALCLDPWNPGISFFPCC